MSTKAVKDNTTWPLSRTLAPAMAAPRKTFHGEAWLVACIVLAHWVLTWEAHTCGFVPAPGSLLLLRLRGGATVHAARIAQKSSASWLSIYIGH